MHTFEIKEDFLLDGEPIKLLSGAIHYFRIHPSDWHHSLYNLKALGFNTVETYVPWNLHEPKEGEFDFSRLLNIEEFIETAESLDLMVIIRPTPYVCAELEFGGLPAWLLNKNCRIRSSDSVFMEYVDQFYKVLLEKLVPYQMTNGGPVIMMQIENEYGSYGEDKEYLIGIKEIMEKYGINIPLFTSDGTWENALESGSMITEGILPTGNFGSDGKENFRKLKEFHEKYDKTYPLMCMEFWGGWFNHWGQPINQRDTEELAEAVREVIELGSINLFMFHGGTNFGFTTGTSGRKDYDLPQITSYDYGAPLDEQGNPTDKYFAIQQVVKEVLPEVEQFEPLVKESMAFENIELKNKVSLFNVIDEVSEKVESKYPLTMEELEHYYGYVLYRTKINQFDEESILKVVDASDRVQVFVNEEYVTTQYQYDIGNDISIVANPGELQVDLLIENIGRVNYGYKLLGEAQRKGIRTGVMHDKHFVNDWEQYKIDFSKVDALDFDKEWIENTPGFYQFEFDLSEVTMEDTYLDVSQFGKGIVLVNGFNIGRYWNAGPTESLYIPKHLLNEGLNKITLFETEGISADEIRLVDEPLYVEENAFTVMMQD